MGSFGKGLCAITLLFPDGISQSYSLARVSPPRLHTRVIWGQSDLGLLDNLAASLLSPVSRTILLMPEWRLKVTRNESVFLPKSKENTRLTQGNGRRKEFKMLSHLNRNEWAVGGSSVLSGSLLEISRVS